MLEAIPLDHPSRSLADLSCQFLYQPGLADARFPGHKKHPPRLRQPLKAAAQPFYLRSPSHEPAAKTVPFFRLFLLFGGERGDLQAPFDLHQRSQGGGGRVVAVLGELFEQLQNQAVDRSGHRGVQLRRTRRPIVELAKDQGGRSFPHEGGASRQHFVEQNTEGIQVRGRPDCISQDLFGSHLLHPARDLVAQNQQRPALGPDLPEAEDPDRVTRLQQHVFGANIPVHDLLLVSRLEGGEHLPGHRQRPIERKRALALQHLAQIFSFPPLFGDIEVPSLLAEAANPRDVGMGHTGSQLHLALAALRLVRMLQPVEGQCLQDHLSFPAFFSGSVRCPPSPALHQIFNPVAAQLPADERIVPCHIALSSACLQHARFRKPSRSAALLLPGRSPQPRSR